MKSEREISLAYLREARGEVLRAVHGVDEYEARRPLTRSGTNLLGIVKHLAIVEHDYVATRAGYSEVIAPRWDVAADQADNFDLWLTADESAAEIIDYYLAVARNTERAAADLPADATVTVPWWTPPESTFDRLLVHLVAETAQHAGHLDILREGIDGQGDAWDEVRPERDEAWWSRLWAEIAAAAEGYRNAGATVEVPEAARV